MTFVLKFNMSSISDLSVPDVPPLSPGSSVSTRLQDEYDELLKFAVVVPKFDPKQLPHTLADARESFLPSSQLSNRARVTAERRDKNEEFSSATDVTPINDMLSPAGPHSPKDSLTTSNRLPDFGWQSPIRDERETKPHDPFQGHYFTTAYGRQQQVEEEDNKLYTTNVDPDIANMENMMDQWGLDLKRNVLAEFGQSKIKIVEHGRQQLIKELEKHASEKLKLLEESNSLKELLATYEQSITRKDQVISNLTNAMNKQREKHELLRTFCEWKIKHNDFKRENFCLSIAKKHHERCLSRNVWDAWFGIIETKWRLRIEKACQAKAQEVCIQLTRDYEDKLATANRELQAARSEIANMNKEREHYEETMKKAFMRGVCALNLEAMTIFHNGDEKENRDIVINGQQQELDENLKSSFTEKDYSASKCLQQDMIVTNGGPHLPKASQTKAQNTRPKSSSETKVFTSKAGSKVDLEKGLGGVMLAPTMTSVIVERHQPVNKQTMPHAVAGQYQKSGTAPFIDKHRKAAGQSTLGKQVHTVKHVD